MILEKLGSLTINKIAAGEDIKLENESGTDTQIEKIVL